MKPRIFFQWGAWVCATQLQNGRRTNLGYGWTPAAAYEDWQLQCRLAGI